MIQSITQCHVVQYCSMTRRILETIKFKQQLQTDLAKMCSVNSFSSLFVLDEIA